MHAKAEAPIIKLTVADVIHVSEEICMSTVIEVISTTLPITCHDFKAIRISRKIILLPLRKLDLTSRYLLRSMANNTA
tara:strand:- start:45 stop:278 length:234 start_codon:yes stop_codon:yes gene_type:complete